MPNKKDDLAKIAYKLYEQSMDAHYSEIIRFLAIIIPSFTAFFYVLTQYLSGSPNFAEPVVFIAIAIVVIFIQVWGGIYALAMSYRFRYLKAAVSKIEKAFGIDEYLPRSFKTPKTFGIRSRLSLDIAPAILQVHVFFFIFSMIAVGVVSSLVVPCPCKIAIALVTLAAVLSIFLMGGWYYPNKLNKMLDVTKGNSGVTK